MNTVVTCRCEHCPQELEFEPARDGESVVCPNCQMETVLTAPARPVKIQDPWLRSKAPRWLDALTSRAAKQVGLGLLILAGFLSMNWGPGVDDSENAAASLPVAPKMAVYRNLTQLIIRNNDQFKWSAKVFINGEDGFKYYLWQIEPGQERAMPLISFIREDGARFQPLQFAPREVTVTADGHQSANFKF